MRARVLNKFMPSISLLPLLKRLSADVRGNTVLLVAAGFIPVAAAIGSAVDLSRAYMAQAKLQQAVDAAALAGRKAMKNNDPKTAEAEVQRFIAYNFPSGLYGTAPFKPQVSSPLSGALLITASTSVPTTVMGMFGYESIAIDASASAVQNFANTDIMLVLDVTGSMDDYVNGSRKINAMRDAVLALYDQLDQAKQQLESQGLRMRIGIVPYANTVNVGWLLWEEQSKVGRKYIDESAARYYSIAKVESDDKDGWKQGTAKYGYALLNVSGWIAEGTNGTRRNDAYVWRGCIEERTTLKTIASDADRSIIPAGALDIIDSEPTSDVTTQWRPYLSLPWTGPDDDRDDDGNEYGSPQMNNANVQKTFEGMPVAVNSKGKEIHASANNSSDPASRGPNQDCNEEAKPLQVWSKRQDLDFYLKKLKPAGTTLHDIGMIWGLRMISPGRPFPNDDVWNGRPVERHIIFMTDGQMNDSEYTAWGRSREEGRIGGDSWGSDSFNDRHTARLEMICEAAKRQGVSIWTVAFATGSVASLEKCATNGDQSFEVADRAKLIEKFSQIGQNIGALRLSH